MGYLKADEKTSHNAPSAYVLLANCGAVLLLASCAIPPSTSSLPTRDVYDQLGACMQNRGWSVSFDEASGGVRGEFRTEQESAYVADMSECTEDTTANSEAVITDERFRAAYEALLVTRECLIEEGFEVASPPTFQQFLDIGGAWSPYLEVPINDLASRIDITKICPQPQIRCLVWRKVKR